MKKIYIISLCAAALLAGGCSKENPFGGEYSGNEGKVLKSALDMSVVNDEIIHSTRAEARAEDFTVVFTKEGESAPAAKYKYADMPEVVVLPEGKYTCTATYGEDRIADWENPYFLGVSEPFDVVAYEITSYIEPIECTLQNVKVTVVFDPALQARMSEDAFVEVKVGDNDGLHYTSTDASAGKAGFFKHTAESTLVATFNGAIDGIQTVETKSFKDVKKGHHYKITFRIHDHNGDGTGDAEINGVKVDATVSTEDLVRNVDLPDEPMLDDSERPREDNPDTPPTPGDKGPKIEGSGNIRLGEVNVVHDGDVVELLITSEAEGGFTTFTCDIDSPTLTPEELENVYLSSHLDLVNPGSLEGPLQELGIPVNVGGQNSVTFKLTDFLGLLGALGLDYTHTFTLTVGDADGTNTKSLILNLK